VGGAGKDPPRPLVTTRDDVTVVAYKLASAVANLTPGPMATATARSLGVTMSYALQSKRAIVERHQRRALPPDTSVLEVSRSATRAFEYYARYWVESFRLPKLSAERVRTNMRVTGFEHLEAGLAAGTGVILALPHLGGWEWAGRWVADQGIPMTVVVEALEPPELLEWFRDLRTDLGMTVVPTGPEAGAASLKALKNNEVLALLSDRDIEGNGVEVTFFGETTTLPAGPVMLGMRTGAPVLPVAVYFEGRGDQHYGHIRPPLDLTRTGKLRDDLVLGTQRLAVELEALIRRAPDQWHLFQPNWPSDLGSD
jgi:phosphatidylinositol dimannoside acyltransferase